MNEMKREIKSLAQEIKSTKLQFKASQREVSKIWLENNFNSNTWYNKPETYHLIENSLRLMCSKQNEVYNLKKEYRLKHIIYSMLRGKTISQIENKTSDDKYQTILRTNLYNEVKKILLKLEKEWLE